MTFTWHDDIELDGGTLEVHETLTAPGPAIQLRVIVVAGKRVEAIWLTESGKCLGEAMVGQA